MIADFQVVLYLDSAGSSAAGKHGGFVSSTHVTLRNITKERNIVC